MPFYFRLDSNDDSSDEKPVKKSSKTIDAAGKKKKHKKHKKHKKASKSEKTDKTMSSRKQKKQHKRKHKESESSLSADPSENEPAPKPAATLDKKFTQLMKSNGHATKKVAVPTDPIKLVEIIAKSLEPKTPASLEIVSSDTESEA